MVDQAYPTAHAKKKDRLIVQIQNIKLVLVVTNPNQLAKSVTHLWIVGGMATEIQVGRRSLQEFRKRPSNRHFKSRRALVESTMTILRLSRLIEVGLEAF